MTVSPVWPGLIEAYRSRLPVSDATPVITLPNAAVPGTTTARRGAPSPWGRNFTTGRWPRLLSAEPASVQLRRERPQPM